MKSNICYHCGEPVYGSGVFSTIKAVTGFQSNPELNEQKNNGAGNREPVFCCSGCKAVYEQINTTGCGDYYRYRTQAAIKVEDYQGSRLNKEVMDFSWADDLLDELDFVKSEPMQDGGLQHNATLLLEGLRCSACAWLVERSLLRVDGVTAARVDLVNQKLTVYWDQLTVKLSTLMSTLMSLGYSSKGWSQNAIWDKHRRDASRIMRYLGVSGIIMMQVGMISIGLYAGELSSSMTATSLSVLRLACFLLTAVSLIYCGAPFYRSAFNGLKKGVINMDVPIVLALTIAGGYSLYSTALHQEHVYFDTITMFLFFLWLSRFFEYQSRGRFQHGGSQSLPELVTRKVSTEDDACIETIALRDLAPGDHLLCKRGDTLAADGIVKDSFVDVDTSAFTGESEAVRIRSGQEICAGSINLGDSFWVTVTSDFGKTSYDKLRELAQKAHFEKPDYQKLIDRISPYFTLVVLFVAALVAAYWSARESGRTLDIVIAVLIVSCPCALSLATPLAVTVANSVSSRLGLVPLRADIWSRLNNINDVIFDKTGTLTDPVELETTILADGESKHSPLRVAASLEVLSSHPLARIFLESNTEPLDDVADFRVVDGFGIEGVVSGLRCRLGFPEWALALERNSVSLRALSTEYDALLVSADGLVAGFRVRESIRPEAPAVISSLKSAGIAVHIFSGDSRVKVAQVAASLGVDSFEGGLTPEGKLKGLKALQQFGAIKRRVLAIGDGVNDAPLLAAADASVAVANASAITSAKADLLQCNESLLAIVQALQLAKATRDTTIVNCLWALAYNIAAISMAAFGLIPPYLAAIGMTLSSLIVLLNSKRIWRFQESSSGYSETDATKEAGANTHREEYSTIGVYL